MPDAAISTQRIFESNTYPAVATNGATTGIRPAIPNLVSIHLNAKAMKIFNPDTSNTLYVRAYNANVDYVPGIDLDTCYPVLPESQIEIETGPKSQRIGDGQIICITTAASSFNFQVMQILSFIT